jgi:hypothetical protein
MMKAIGGRNRTGMSAAIDRAEEMVAATREFPPTSDGSARALADVRIEYARTAEPFGTMPPPPAAARLATSGRAMTGDLAALLDELGERAAFERTGTRLYEALISKHDAGMSFRGGPSRDDLVHVRDEEHEHFLMLGDAIRRLDGDPTVVTPSANLQATAGQGLCAVLADPRTTVLQCLEALLTAELVDNDCWPALIEVAAKNGETALAERLAEAQRHEVEHLERVRAWIAAGTGRSGERARMARVASDPGRAPGARQPERAKANRRGASAASLRRRRGAARKRARARTSTRRRRAGGTQGKRR